MPRWPNRKPSPYTRPEYMEHLIGKHKMLVLRKKMGGQTLRIPKYHEEKAYMQFFRNPKKFDGMKVRMVATILGCSNVYAKKLRATYRGILRINTTK